MKRAKPYEETIMPTCKSVADNSFAKMGMNIMEANNAGDRLPCLFGLRHELESFKIAARLCHESGGFSSTRSYLHLAERITNIAKQNEGWIKSTQSRTPRQRAPRSNTPEQSSLPRL